MKEFIDKLIERLEEELIPLNQEITKYFYELKDTDNPKYIYSVGRSNALTDFKYTINELAEEFAPDINVGTNVSEMPTGWIPCSERLPEVNGWYLVTNNLGVVQQLYWCASRWHKMCDWAVIAWMPLPAPYTEGE